MRLSKSWLCFLALLGSFGCVSTSRIMPSSLGASGEMEWVIVTTQASEQVEITNPVVENDSLIGFEIRDGRRGPRVAIPLTEISDLSHKHFDATRTLLWAGVVGAVFLVTWAYVNANL